MNTEPTFQILNLATQETFTWTLTEILKEINRDRSEEWTDYNSEDWREGWDYWVEGEYYSMEGATRRDFI
jgi:hypothetical protein